MNVRNALGTLALTLGAGLTLPSGARAGDAIPSTIRAHATSELAARGPMKLATAGTRAYTFEPDAVASTDARPAQRYWPVLFSALVPGAGEISMGYYKRGIALVVAEAIAWTGYATKHSDGIDKRTEYENFADAHWDMQKWIDDHPCSTLPPTGRTLEDIEDCGQASSGSGAWPGYIPFVARAEDKQHYYENVGKYDWYISGWEDWDPARVPYAHETGLRDQYRSMRMESNSALDDADAFIWVSVAARAFSLAEAAILVHNRRGAAGATGSSPVSLRAEPRGLDGCELALEVRF
jgi:hypothetical protein